MASVLKNVFDCEVTLQEYLFYCCTGRLPKAIAQAMARGGFLSDLTCFAQMIGWLEPACITRPGACDPVIFISKQIVVPPATMDVNTGRIIPSEVRAISYCAPLNRALVIAESRVTAGNLTGASQPTVQPLFKRVNLGGFGDAWCLPFEPIDEEGLFVNVEHIVVPPQAGFSVFVQNFNTESEAVYHLSSRMWACC